MLKHILVLLIISFISQPLWAGKILRQKGKTVIIDIRGENVSRGDKVNVYNNGKKRGVLRVSKVNKKGTKAMAKVILGKARKGWMAGEESGSGDMSAAQDTAMETSTTSKKKTHYGALLGFSQDTMNVTLTSGEKEFSGSGISAKAAMDYAFSDSFGLRAKTGVEIFNATGDAILGDACVSCEVEITYFTLEGLGQLYFGSDKYKFWIGAGGAIAHPMSGSSNAVNVDELSTTSAIQAAGGMNIGLKSGSYIPLEFTYSMLQESESVSATYLTLSAGYMF